MMTDKSNTNPPSFISATAVAVVLGISQCIAQSPEDLFTRFEKGDFIALTMTNGGIVLSGWEMESEDGKPYHRGFLKAQVDELVKGGREAVAPALKRLDHPHMHIRYIAAESLRRITKQDPIWYTFGTPGETFNGNKTWSNDATTEWRGWYEATANKIKKQNKMLR